jgi:hypothetical protein
MLSTAMCFSIGAMLACLLCCVFMVRSIAGSPPRSFLDELDAQEKRFAVLANRATGKPYHAVIDQMRSEGLGAGAAILVYRAGGTAAATLPSTLGVGAAFGVDDAGIVQLVSTDVKAPIVAVVFL